MTTSNKAVQNIYDDSHDNASSGKIKINDLDTRLYLSGLFNSEVYQVQPISIGFTVQSINLSLLMKKKNTGILITTMKDNSLLKLDYGVNNLQELQVNHILQDIYFRHSAAKLRKYSELTLIADCISCFFGTLWFSHDRIRLLW